MIHAIFHSIGGITVKQSKTPGFRIISPSPCNKRLNSPHPQGVTLLYYQMLLFADDTDLICKRKLRNGLKFLTCGQQISV